jgi:hypothetical protein
MKNEKKISKNKIADWSDKMDTKYGKQGSETRTNFETKAQVRGFVNKLEKDNILEDEGVEDAREGLSDREQSAEEVLYTVRGLLDDVRDDAVQERVDELEQEKNQLYNIDTKVKKPLFLIIFFLK